MQSKLNKQRERERERKMFKKQREINKTRKI